MVSALASSSVRLPRNVSVKVLVSDWDLLRGKEKSSLVDYFLILDHICVLSAGPPPPTRRGLTSAVVTVSAPQARRRQGWDQAGRPGWVRWWLTGLAEVNPGLTGRERRKQSGVPLQ